MADVFIAGVAATRFDRGCAGPALPAYEAATAALADAGVAGEAVGAVFLACAGGSAATADALSVRLALRRCGVRTGPRGRAEQVSASGARALHLAWRAVEVGLHDVVLCVGADRGPDGASASPSAAALLRRRGEAARGYLARSGATVEHLARAAVKNRRHGARNPRAAAGEVPPAWAVLESAVVAAPLTRLMVARPGAGAAAVVLASARARRGPARGRPRVRASVLATIGGEDPDRAPAGAVELAYRNAGLGPDELDCAELNDVTAAAEVAAYEALRFAPAGHGADLIDAGYTALGGVLPVNPSGGLLGLGELDGASGVAQVCELAWQLRGRAAGRQVPGARAALALSGGPGEDGARVAGLTVLSAA